MTVVIKEHTLTPVLYFVSGIIHLPAPSQPPGLIVAYSISSTSSTVEWSQLVEEQFQGQPVGYHIRYYSRPLGPESEKFLRVNYQTNTTILTNLTVYTIYEIFVSAVSSGGVGPENQAETRTDAEGRRELAL